MKLLIKENIYLPIYMIGWFRVSGIINPYIFGSYEELIKKKKLETNFAGHIDEGQNLIVFFDDIECNYYEVICAYQGITKFIKNTGDPSFPYTYRFTLEHEVRVSNPTVLDFVNNMDDLKFAVTHNSRKKL